jgi:hypothetical protein
MTGEEYRECIAEVYKREEIVRWQIDDAISQGDTAGPAFRDLIDSHLGILDELRELDRELRANA